MNTVDRDTNDVESIYYFPIYNDLFNQIGYHQEKGNFPFLLGLKYIKCYMVFQSKYETNKLQQ